MAVLHDGVKSVVRIGRSRKAEACFLTDTDISWGLQVAVMFQIMSTMALELPSFLEALEDIRGISPDVQLDYEPWGHMDHNDGHCYCRCNRLRCPLARMSGLQCFNMGHNGHGINLYGVSMTLMGN